MRKETREIRVNIIDSVMKDIEYRFNVIDSPIIAYDLSLCTMQNATLAFDLTIDELKVISTYIEVLKVRHFK